MQNAEIIRLLAAAAPLAGKLAVAGMDADLTAGDRMILAGLREARDGGAFEGEWQTDELRRAAGLGRSDLALLLWILHKQDMEADPKGTLIETLALLRHTNNKPEKS